MAEDMRPLGQRTETLLLRALPVARGSVFLHILQAHIPTGQCKEGQVIPTRTVGCITEETLQAYGT